MKRLNGCRIMMALIGLVAAVMFGAGIVKADFTFGEATNMGPTINSTYFETPNCISSDGLEMYLGSDRPGMFGRWDLWVAKRDSVEDDWNEPVNLGPRINTTHIDGCPYVSSDGLELYYHSYERGGGYGHYDIWLTKRTTKDDEWSIPDNLGPPINSSYWEACACLTGGGLELYFISRNLPGGYGSDDIWVSRRATKDDSWEEPVNLGAPVNSPTSECYPRISSDGLLLVFSGDTNAPQRSGGHGGIDIWMARRTGVSEPWDTPKNLGPAINTPSDDGIPVISPDGKTLYFSSFRPGGHGTSDIYQAPIIPIVDLNSDGIVDSADMVIMVDNWGTDNSLCDIGPMPWGDGIVDVKDLIVLAEHLFEEVPPVE